MVSEKFMQQLLWGLTICLGGYLLARGILYIRDDSSESVHETLSELSENIEEQALELCFPQYLSREDSAVSSQTGTISVWNQIPLIQYIQNHSNGETMTEDPQTTEEIITLHNKLLMEDVLIENQNVTDEQQEETSLESVETAEEPQEEVLPAWAQVTENAADIDLSMESLQNFDYLLNQFFVVDANTTVDSQQINAQTFFDMDMTLDASGEGPQILIYHTHSQEGYADSIPQDENTSVIGVGNYLTELLETVFGYQVIHVKNTFDLIDGELERSKAYNNALPVIQQILEENPTIQVVIDLHRDGVAEDKHLVTEINGKPTAQIMFFNGLSRNSDGVSLDSLPNPYITENLSFAFQLSYQAARYYPDFTRCIYLKGYRYNLHLRPRSILLEVGAQTNTVEEAKNAMEPFSVLLNKVLKGE